MPEKYTCQRCGYNWTGRADRREHPKPAGCPNCSSRKWDKKKEAK